MKLARFLVLLLLQTLFAVTAQANANGDDVAYTNTHVTAGNQVQTTSGGDTNLIGATVTAPQVTANVGGDLNIQSLQDTSQYDSKQQSIGGSITVGPSVSGSLSVSQSKINSDYQSVNEQSGIRAGDEGFKVDVKGNTDLKGGAITSTQQAIDDNKNSFTTGGELTLSDIHNEASYSANSAGINIGAGTSLKGELTPQGSGAGYGKDSDSASSTTLASISGIAGNKDARTGDAETGIKPIFDADKVQKNIDAQLQITQTFGQQASKALGDYATAQLNKAQQLRTEANAQQDPAQKAQLLAQAQEIENNWQEGGAYRIAAHAIIGGLTGKLEGALGAGTAAAAAPTINELTQDMPEGVKQAVGAAIATGLGAIVGGQAGAATAFNEDMNNRQLHPGERDLIRKLAKEKAAEVCKVGGSGSGCVAEQTTYWNDLLTHVAESWVDANQYAYVTSYLDAVLATTQIPESRGAVDVEARKYLTDFGTAAAMLESYKGQPIVYTPPAYLSSMTSPSLLGWKADPFDGVLTYFSVTEEQWKQPFAYDPVTNRPYMYPSSFGMVARDQQFLTRQAGSNERIEPVHPVEEVALTVMGARPLLSFGRVGGGVSGGMGAATEAEINAARIAAEMETTINVGNAAKTAEKVGAAAGGAGKLTIGVGEFSASERAAAQYMADLGNDVVLRSPVGTRAAGGTSDLLVNGVPYDVYTPVTNNPNRIVSSIANKNSQATGIVLDLSKTSVTPEQLGNVLDRVRGAGATNITDIKIMGK